MAATEDIPEILAAIAEFVCDPEPYTIGGVPPLDLRAIVAQVGLLPAMLDMGGCLGLLKNGEVASFLWDDPYSLRPETDPRISNTAYYQASRKYPGLAPLVPRRPVDALTCPHCAGAGRCRGFPAEFVDGFICYCGGLGWLPNQDPDWNP